ncbi:hypothetical protein CAEBREN_07001 [Caenorhabditis brenneri]|uniref:Uncharacterized protein n=1 Tax=Caenorhabditis brenneri TaxID=135651 RepID=G0P4L4_CAEBE|nr:hypothetical protein CAEBREN_07001 [Caenorhabditis brenneri]
MNVYQEIAAISHQLTKELTVEQVAQQMERTAALQERVQNEDELFATLVIQKPLFQAHEEAVRRENGEPQEPRSYTPPSTPDYAKPLPPAPVRPQVPSQVPSQAVSQALAAKETEISKLKKKLRDTLRRENTYETFNRDIERELGRIDSSLKTVEAENTTLKNELAELRIQMEIARLEGKYEEQSRMLAETRKELDEKSQMFAELSKK